MGIPWPCLHEFLAIVTHPRIYAPYTPGPGSGSSGCLARVPDPGAVGRIADALGQAASATRRQPRCRSTDP
jgi:hypothetical protein